MNELYKVCISWDIDADTRQRYFQPEILATGQDIYFSFKNNNNSFYEINSECDSNIYLTDALNCDSINISEICKPFIFIKNNGFSNLYINATENTGNFFCFKDYQQIGLTNVFRRNIKLEPKEAVAWSLFSNYNGQYYESHFCYPFAFFYNFCNIRDINPSGNYPVYQQQKTGFKYIECTGLCCCTASYSEYLDSTKELFYSFSTGSNFDEILFINKDINQVCNYLIDFYQNQYSYDYEYCNFYTLTCYTGLNNILYNSGDFFYLSSGYCAIDNQILESGYKKINLNDCYISHCVINEVICCCPFVCEYYSFVDNYYIIPYDTGFVPLFCNNIDNETYYNTIENCIYNGSCSIYVGCMFEVSTYEGNGKYSFSLCSGYEYYANTNTIGCLGECTYTGIFANDFFCLNTINDAVYDGITCGVYHLQTGVTGQVSGIQNQSEYIDYYINVSGFFNRNIQENYFCLKSGYSFDSGTYSVFCGNCNPVDFSGIIGTDDHTVFYLENNYCYDNLNCFIYCKDIQVELDQEILNSTHCYYNINGNIFPTGSNEYTGEKFISASGYFNSLGYQYNGMIFVLSGIPYSVTCCVSGFHAYKNFIYQNINEKNLPTGYAGDNEYFFDITKRNCLYQYAFGTEKQCLCISYDTGLNNYILDTNSIIKSLSFESFVDSGACLCVGFFKEPNCFITGCCKDLSDYTVSKVCRDYFFYVESGCNDFYRNGFICAYSCIYSGDNSGSCEDISYYASQPGWSLWVAPLIHECEIRKNPIIYSHKASFCNGLSGYNNIGDIKINQVKIATDKISCSIDDFISGKFNLEINEDTNICLYFNFDFENSKRKNYIVRGYMRSGQYPSECYSTIDCGNFIYYNNDNKNVIPFYSTLKTGVGFNGEHVIYIENTGDVYYQPNLDENASISDIFTKDVLYYNMALPTKDILDYDYCFTLNEIGRSLFGVDKTALSGCYTTYSYLIDSVGDSIWNNCITLSNKYYSGACTVICNSEYVTVCCGTIDFCIYDLNLCINECNLNTNSLENKNEYSSSEEYAIQYLTEQNKISLHGLDFYYSPAESVTFQDKRYEINDEDYLYSFQLDSGVIQQNLYIPKRALNTCKFKIITDSEISNKLTYINTHLCYKCGFDMVFEDQNPKNLVNLKIPKINRGHDSPNISTHGITAINVKRNINLYQNIFENLDSDTEFGLNNLLYFVKSYISSGMAYDCVSSWMSMFGETGYCQAINEIYQYDSQEYNFLMIDLNNEIKKITGSHVVSDWSLINSYSSDCSLNLNYPISYRPNSGQGYNYILPIANHISLCNTVCGNTGYYSGEFSESINFNDVFNYKITGGCLESSLQFAPLWNETGQYFESGGSIPYCSNINLYGNCFDINLCKDQIISTDCRNMILNKNYNFTGIQPLFINSNYVLSTISLPITCSNLEIYEPSQTGLYLSGVFYYLYDIFNFIQTPIRISSPDLTSIESICWQERECNKVLSKYTNNDQGLIKNNAAEINYLANCFRDTNTFNYILNPINEIKINIVGGL